MSISQDLAATLHEGMARLSAEIKGCTPKLRGRQPSKKQARSAAKAASSKLHAFFKNALRHPAVMLLQCLNADEYSGRCGELKKLASELEDQLNALVWVGVEDHSRSKKRNRKAQDDTLSAAAGKRGWHVQTISAS